MRRRKYITNKLIIKAEELIPEKLLKSNIPTNIAVIITKNFSNLSTIFKNSFGFTEINQNNVAEAKTVPKNPKKLIKKKGTWRGTNIYKSPNIKSDTRTNKSTAAGVIQDRGTKTTYYNDYYYYKDGADKNGNIIKATVRYFYTDSSRSAKAYAEHAVSYGPVTD